MHLLMHSFAVWSLDNEVPVGYLQNQLGHASLATSSCTQVQPEPRAKEAFEVSALKFYSVRIFLSDPILWASFCEQLSDL